MKRGMLFIIIIMTGWALAVHAATLGKVVKIQGNLLLIRFDTREAKTGDTVQISRETGNGLVSVGTARVMRIAGDQAGAKILTRQPGLSVEQGDLITDKNDSAGFSSGDEVTDDRSAMEKLLSISNPFIQDNDAAFEDLTALERLRFNLRDE
jgi:hypothetical protein